MPFDDHEHNCDLDTELNCTDSKFSNIFEESQKLPSVLSEILFIII